MKFDFTKTAFFIPIFFLSFQIAAMEESRKKLDELTATELQEYNKAIFGQFCAVQRVKQKFFEVQSNDPRFKGIDLESGDTIADFKEYFDDLKGVFLADKDWYSLHIQVGNWCFLRQVSYNAASAPYINEFWLKIYQTVNAQFDHTRSKTRVPQSKFGGKTGTPYLEYTHIYKIDRTIDGDPIPFFPCSVVLTKTQRKELWSQMKIRYVSLTATEQMIPTTRAEVEEQIEQVTVVPVTQQQCKVSKGLHEI